MKEEIFITGMGIISSVGNNIANFKQALMNGKNNIQYDEEMSSSLKRDIVSAKIPLGVYGDMLLEESRNIAKYKDYAHKSGKRDSMLVQSSILACMEAWKQAELEKSEINLEKMGIVIAGHNMSQMYSYDNYQKYNDKIEYVNPRYALQYMDTNLIGVISDLFKIKGESITVGGASATGNVGLIKACDAIQLGKLDKCMVIAPVTELSPFEVQAFLNIGALGGRGFGDNPSLASRPFDIQHEGFIYGQATACVILESRKSIQDRNAKALAQVMGSAIGLSPSKLSEPSLDAEVAVMEKTLANAGVSKKDIDYINAHGSSSKLGDEVEVKAIEKVFEPVLENIYVNSTKAISGHCLQSAGLVETIATVIQLNENFIHGNINMIEPISDKIQFSPKQRVDKQINIAMNNSFAFGGINTSVILKSVL